MIDVCACAWKGTDSEICTDGDIQINKFNPYIYSPIAQLKIRFKFGGPNVENEKSGKHEPLLMSFLFYLFNFLSFVKYNLLYTKEFE